MTDGNWRDLSVGESEPTDASTSTAKMAEGLPLDILTLVDPELRSLATMLMSSFSQLPVLSEQSLGIWRAMNVRAVPELLSEVPVEHRQIPGPHGAPDVEVHVINAKAGTSRPGIVQMHGGGFVLGSAQPQLRALQELAAELDCAIVSVEYRLAPETDYTGSLEDNYAALRWMHEQASDLGVDRSRIAVMGGSAGGGHAALLAITARNRGEVPVCFQMLLYPMLDDRTGSSRQLPPHIGSIMWTAENNRYGWRSLLGQEPGTAAVPPSAVPARVTNLSGLPATFIGIGALDLFVDENIEYARRLVLSGVPTELHVVPGAFHGFEGLGVEASVSKDFKAAMIKALKRAFGR